MIVQVIPNIRMPRRSKFFDYCVSSALEKSIKPGVMVKIPWRKSVITGIVYNIAKTSQFKNLKSITAVIDFQLPNWELKLIPWFADYYAISYSSALYTFLPEPPQKKVTLKKFIPKNKIITNPNPVVDLKEIKLIKKSSWLFLEDYKQRLAYLNYFAQKDQTVIIFPTVDELNRFYFRLDKDLQKQTDIFTNQLTKSQTWDIWQRASKNNFKLILATRLGIFLPTTKVNFVIDQIERLEYKQTDMNPRYNALEIIKQCLLDSESSYYFLSFSFKTDLYTSFKKSGIDIYFNHPLKHKLRFITHNSNQKKLDFIKTLTDKQNIFIFINRKGSFNSLACSQCHWTARCPIDNNLLKLHQGLLKCHDCNHQEPEPFKCPKCSNKNLVGQGIGAHNIEMSLQKTLGHDFNIYRWDSDLNNKKNDNLKINWKQKNIIVGTEYALTKLPLDVFSSVIFFNADTDLLFSDYLSPERVLNLYHRLLRQINSQVEIIINTTDPDNIFWQNLVARPLVVINQEIKHRQKFFYPPFTKLTKLIYAATDEVKVKKIAQTIYKKLKNESLVGYEIFPPQPAKPYREHRKYYYDILIKAKSINLQPILKYLDNDWLVDRDPQKL